LASKLETQEKNKALINLVLCGLSSGAAVWSYLKGGLSFFMTAYLGPIGGFIFSGIAFIFVRALKNQYPKNIYIQPITCFVSVISIPVIIFFAGSAILMPFYDRSFYGEKKDGPTDYLSIKVKGVSQDSVYKIKTEPDKKTSVKVLFYTKDEAVKKLKVELSYRLPLGDKKSTVDRRSVQSTNVEPKTKGFMFLDVRDVNGCDVKLNVILSSHQTKTVKVFILYTYYYLSKWKKYLRYLLERYYT